MSVWNIIVEELDGNTMLDIVRETSDTMKQYGIQYDKQKIRLIRVDDNDE